MIVNPMSDASLEYILEERALLEQKFQQLLLAIADGGYLDQSLLNAPAATPAPAATSVSATTITYPRNVPTKKTIKSIGARLGTLEKRVKITQAIGSDTQTLDMAFVIDCTSSMQPVFDKVEQKLTDILEGLKRDFPYIDAKVAYIGFRDHGEDMGAGTRHFIIHDFTTAVDIKRKIKGIKAEGGGDGAEDMLGALYQVLHSLSWSSRFRIVLLFTDAPPHGNRFHVIPDDYPEPDVIDRYYVTQPFPQQTWLEECARMLCEKRIVTKLLCVGEVDLSMTVREFQNAFSVLPNGRDKFQMARIEYNPKDFVAQVTSSIMVAGARKPGKRTG